MVDARFVVPAAPEEAIRTVETSFRMGLRYRKGCTPEGGPAGIRKPMVVPRPRSE
jgi:hypothetical protein